MEYSLTRCAPKEKEILPKPSNPITVSMPTPNINLVMETQEQSSLKRTSDAISKPAQQVIALPDLTASTAVDPNVHPSK